MIQGSESAGRASLPCSYWGRPRWDWRGVGARVVLLVVVAILQGGCYNYAPLRRSRLVPSVYLALTLTESGSEELMPTIGPNILVIRGRFLSASERGLSLSVQAVETRRGDVLEWKGETVEVPNEFVRDLEERQTATGKTVLLAGASLVGFFAAYAAFGPGSSSSTVGGQGPGPSPH